MPDGFDIKALLTIGDNTAAIARFVTQARTPMGVIPFVGAGMSVPFGFPQWGEFLRQQAPSPAIRAVVQSLLNEGKYEDAAQAVFDARGGHAFQVTFEAAFGIGALGSRDDYGAIAHIARLASGPVVTTNYERVLETAFEHAGTPFEAVIAGARIDLIRAAMNQLRRVLIKIHGDANDRTDRILTRSDYERHYAGELFADILGLVLGRPVLFLGCSLKQDRTVDVLRNLANDTMDHFAVAEQPATPEEFAVRARQFSELYITPIWYPTGRHSDIEPLLAYLADRRADRPAAVAGAGPSASSIKHNGVPRPLSPLIGRTDEVARIRNALMEGGAPRLVSIEGPEGVGKTAVLFTVLAEILEEGRHFSGVVWASARDSALTLDDVLDRISMTLDFPHKAGVSTAEKKELVQEQLARSNVRCLVALDSFERIKDADLRRFITADLPERCVALIASDLAIDSLPLGSTTIRLEPLCEADAQALLEREADRVGVNVSAATAAEIGSAVGGMPLAIELAVGQLRAGHQASWIVADVAAGNGRIFSMIASSWAGLDAPCRIVLAAGSLFPVTFSEDALSAASGLSAADFRAAILMLNQRYLLRAVEVQTASGAGAATLTMFVLHPLTRAFSRARTSEIDPGSLCIRRAAAYFIDFITARGGTPEKEEAADLAALNVERQNILAVMRACRDEPHRDLLVRMVAAAARWLFIDGHWADLELWGTHGADAAMVCGDRSAAARIRAEVARVFAYRGNFSRADALFATALADAEAAADVYAGAYIKHHIADSLIRRKKFAGASRLLDESLAAFKSLGATRAVIGVSYRKAVLAYESGDAEAEALFKAGVEACADDNWARLEAYHRNYLGDIAAGQDRFADARYQLKRAHELTPPTDSRRLALIELSLARIELKAGRLASAAEWGTRARDHLRKLGMRKEQEEAEMILISAQ